MVKGDQRLGSLASCIPRTDKLWSNGRRIAVSYCKSVYPGCIEVNVQFLLLAVVNCSFDLVSENRYNIVVGDIMKRPSFGLVQLGLPAHVQEL